MFAKLNQKNNTIPSDNQKKSTIEVQLDNHKSNRYKEWFWLVPIYLTVLIIPLLVNAKKVYLLETNSQFTKYGNSYVDLFAFQRSQLLIWTGIIGVLLLILYRIDGNDGIKSPENSNHLKQSFVLSITYVGFVLLSMTLSKYPDLAYFGALQRFEGGFVIISYLVLFWMSMVFINREAHLKLLILSITAAASIIVILGLLQVAQVDFYKFSLFNQLVYLFEDKKGQLIHSNEKIKQIFATLYNTNYFGAYLTLIYPFFIGVYYITKQYRIRIFSFILMIITWTCIFGSESRTAFVGALLGLSSMTLWAKLKTFSPKLIIICVSVIPIGFLLAQFFMGDSFLFKFSTLNPIKEKELMYQSRSKLQELSFLDYEVRLNIDSNIIRFIWQKDEFMTLKKDDTAFITAIDSEKKRTIFQEIGDGKYSYRLIPINDNVLINIKLNNIRFDLYGDDTGLYLISPQATKFNYEETAEVIGFKNNQQFGAFRGHIWSRTIPLLKDTVFVGHGPDTYIAYYPQHDWTSLLNNFGGVIIVDKPHNYYLQVAHDTGIISLVILLCLFLNYFFKSLIFTKKIYRDHPLYWYNAIMMTSVLCYLFASIFNDSVVYIAPVFWVILGAGYAVIKISSSHNTVV